MQQLHQHPKQMQLHVPFLEPKNLSTCMSIISEYICCAKTPEIESLTSYTGITKGSELVSFTSKNIEIPTTAVAAGIITITGVNTNGVYTTASGTGTIASFNVNDAVVIDGCTVVNNKGYFKISDITGNAITLVDRFTEKTITTDADASSCTIATSDEVPIGVVTISTISTAGVYTTSDGAPDGIWY